MQSTGDSWPKTSSWRIHQGAMTARNSPKQATAAQTGIAGRRAPADRHARQRS